MLSPLRVDQREATVVQRDRRSVRCLCLRRLRLRLAVSNSTAKTALNHAGYSVLLIGTTIAIGAVIMLRILRRRKSNDLDSLGAVSSRWIAEERAASHDGLRSIE
jgi:hypothetical protein